MRRRVGAGLAAVAVLTAAGLAWNLTPAGADHRDPDSADRTTAAVERTTLSAGLTLSGQLGYGAATQVPGTGEGMVTALPAAGAVVPTGQVLYAVDGRPVFTLTGDTPLWRDLAPGDSGPDVLALRTSLAALGYDVGAADSDVFDAALAAALGALYRDRGYPEPKDLPGAQTARDEADQEAATARAALARAEAALSERTAGPTAGERTRAEAAIAEARRTLDQAEEPDQPAAAEQLRAAEAELADLLAAVDASAEQAEVRAARTALTAAEQQVAAAAANRVRAGELVLVPAAAVRVDAVTAVLGQRAADTVLSWTATEVRAYATLSAAQAQQIATGAAVELTLPDTSPLAGTVVAIEPATTDADGQTTGPTLVVDLADQAAVADLGLPAVKVTLPTQEAADALVVPVTALLALAEGGYALERVDPDDATRTELVPVEVGLVADARAQVITDRVAEGDTVVIP